MSDLTPVTMVPLPDRELLAAWLYRRYNPGLSTSWSGLSTGDQLRGLADADALLAMLIDQVVSELTPAAIEQKVPTP